MRSKAIKRDTIILQIRSFRGKRWIPGGGFICTIKMTHPQILLIFGSFLGGGRGYRDFLFETARMGVYLYHSDDPHPNFVHFWLIFGGWSRVPGLPIRDCAASSNNLVPRGTKVSAIGVTAKTFFERLYVILGLAPIGALSKDK